MDHQQDDDEKSLLVSKDSTNDMGSGSLSSATAGTPTKNLLEIGRLFEERVKVKDRRYRLRLFRDTFIGTDAVTCLVEILQQIDSRYTRELAETLGRHLAREFNLFEHVSNDRVLYDDYFMYRFVDEQKRRKRSPPSSQTDDAQFLDRLLLGDVIDESFRFDEVVALGMLSDTFGGAASLKGGESAESYGASSDEFLQGLSVGTGRPSRRRNLPLDDINLQVAAEVFERGVEVKTHRYHGRAYENSFIGTDAFDFLIAAGLATSRKRAELVGQALMDEFHLFEHVSRDHGFKDDYLFYRFVPRKERRNVDMTTSSLQDSFQSLTSREQPLSLQDIAEALEQSIKVEDRRFRLKTYKQCFVGSDAVSFLVGSLYAPSRTEAVDLGRRIAEELNLFEHVTQQHQFEDDFFFYRFKDPSVRKIEPITRDIQSPTADIPQSLSRVAADFRNNVSTKTNCYHFKRYKRTFIGNEAVSYLVNASFAKTRKDAVVLGQRLSNDLNLFHHVKNDHPFKDDFLFYRFTGDDEHSSSGSSQTRAPESLEEIGRAMRKNIRVKDRRWYHKVYKDCFLGSDAVSYLVNSGAATDRQNALELGNEIARTCKVFEHVEQNHVLKDEQLFYRFTIGGKSGEEHSLSILRSLAKRLHDGIEVKTHRYRLRVYKCTFTGEEAVSFMVDSDMAKSREDAVVLGKKFASTFHLFEHVTRDHEFEDAFFFYRFIPEDQRLLWKQIPEALEESFVDGLDDAWNKKLAAFGAKASQRRLDANGSLQLSGRPGSSLGDIKNLETLRLRIWLSAFRRLDPRWRILNFFAEVAQLGASENLQLDSVHPLLWFLSRSTVFTVWRPTHFEAIRKMMTGEAVGKGLDIKGKSAKRGKLAGFIPFLQISENWHKPMVRTICKLGRIRLYFSEDSFGAREAVVDYLEAVAGEMMEAADEAKRILSDENVDAVIMEEAKETLLWDMNDVSITYLDEYAPVAYGIEIPARLLWEAYVIRQDCYCKPGSQYDSGRPSSPAFQDMNLATLQVSAKEGCPRVVLWSNASSSYPLNVHELIMAYEENGRVLPVVSDFDPFLVGTRRVHFDPVHGGLPSDQQNMLRWCVNQIETILDSPSRPESWTNRWFEVLMHEKRKGFYPTIPRFGFGDPKSYSIIENAVGRLTQDGSVRHGAECFNFYFPQELDENFLVIYDGLGVVPWLYMNGEELRKFLAERIDDGFTFPLNPKWVLCDPGWKELYDKLISSDKEDIVNSMKIWYPHNSGVREKIEDICSRHPKGFVRGLRQ